MKFSDGPRNQGCGVEVASSRLFLGGVEIGFLRTLGVGVEFFYRTPNPEF